MRAIVIPALLGGLFSLSGCAAFGVSEEQVSQLAERVATAATKAATATALDRAGSYLDAKLGTAKPDEIAAKVAAGAVDTFAAKIISALDGRAPPPPPPDGGSKFPVNSESAILSGILLNEIVKQFQRRNGNGAAAGGGGGGKAS